MNSRKRAIESLNSGILILEELYNGNVDRFAERLSWAYSEAGTMFLYWDEIDSSLALFEKSFSVLERTDSDMYIPIFASMAKKIMDIISHKLHQNEAENEKSQVMHLFNKYFKFLYKRIVLVSNDIPELLELLFYSGMSLTIYYEKKDTKTAKEYYQIMVDIGNRVLSNKLLKNDKRREISILVEIMTGFLAKTEQ